MPAMTPGLIFLRRLTVVVPLEPVLLCAKVEAAKESKRSTDGESIVQLDRFCLGEVVGLLGI